MTQSGHEWHTIAAAQTDPQTPFRRSSKWLELIKEIAPKITRVAFIFNPEAGPYAQKYTQSIAPIAPALGVKLMITPTRDVAEIDHAVAAVSDEPRGGLIVSPDAFTVANRSFIISLAAHYAEVLTLMRR